jgi:hypothetical protein
MFAQDRLDDLALDTDSAAVNDADFPETAGDSLVKVFFHNDLNLAWLEGVEVDGVLNRDFVHRSRI